MVLVPLAKYEILQKQNEGKKTEESVNNASLTPQRDSAKDASVQTTEAERGGYPYAVLPRV